MSYVFQTENKVLFVMKFVMGGELFSYLRKVQRFKEDNAKLYCAMLCHAIGYLHESGVVYRDLKPENVLIGEDGYLCVTDFGLAKQLYEGEVATTVAGTPEYMAPEILNQGTGIIPKGYSLPVDWWSIGCITFEMIVGLPPFYHHGQSTDRLFERVVNNPIKFPDEDPRYAKLHHKIPVSPDARDFLLRLLDKDPDTRLGSNGGLAEVLAHPWLASIDHESLLKKDLEPPYKPKVNKANALDVGNFDEVFTGEEAVLTAPHLKLDREE
jgi:serum/glucocorticoid-regulated kinase 2